MTVLVMFLLLSAVQGPPADCRADAPAVPKVRAVAEAIIAADNARDIDRVLSLYTADAILMPPNGPPLQGRTAIRPNYEALFAAFDPAIEGRIDEACASGNLAFVRGHNGGRLVNRGSAPARALNDFYLMLLRFDDGAWRISHLIWHAGTAPQ